MARTENKIKRLSVFDHVNHIRKEQDPEYYNNLSEDDRKSFNHFMILRALSMDASIVGEMAYLYKYLDIIPSPAFYKLLISLVPKSYKFYPWVKTKVLKHNKELLKLIAKKFKCSTYQANQYINIWIRTEEGQQELISICKGYGLIDDEINELFDYNPGT